MTGKQILYWVMLFAWMFGLVFLLGTLVLAQKRNRDGLVFLLAILLAVCIFFISLDIGLLLHSYGQL